VEQSPFHHPNTSKREKNLPVLPLRFSYWGGKKRKDRMIAQCSIRVAYLEQYVGIYQSKDQK
jgi:hypothetical protein